MSVLPRFFLFFNFFSYGTSASHPHLLVFYFLTAGGCGFSIEYGPI